MRMTMCLTSRGKAVLVLAALLAGVASAHAGMLRPLDEGELARSFARGPLERTPPAWHASTQLAPDGTDTPGHAGADAALLLALSLEGVQGLDAQLAQQRAPTAEAGLRSTLTLMQTMTQVLALLGPAGRSGAPLPFPLLFTLPSLPGLSTLAGRH